MTAPAQRDQRRGSVHKSKLSTRLWHCQKTGCDTKIVLSSFMAEAHKEMSSCNFPQFDSITEPREARD